MSHELYVRILSAMFLFWNTARLLTYLPTIGKLLTRGADVRSHSLLSWGSWALSNGTFALMLLEMSRGTPTPMFWMNLGNTMMCGVVATIIVLKRFPRLRLALVAICRKITGKAGNAWAAASAAGVLAIGVAAAVAHGVSSGQVQQGAVESAPVVAQVQRQPDVVPTTATQRSALAGPPAPVRSLTVARVEISDTSASQGSDSATRTTEATEATEKMPPKAARQTAARPRPRPAPIGIANLFDGRHGFFRRVNFRPHSPQKHPDDYTHR